eukprot:gene18941-24749_t
MSINSVSGRNLVINIENNDISYDIARGSANKPAIMFLPGLIRQKDDAKSITLKSICKKLGLTFLCADYLGVGKSSGKFEDGSISRWTSDTIAIISELITSNEKKVVLVGHGLGAWVSLIVARERPDIVAGIIGLAADPDFTEELLWKKLSDEVKEKILNEGVYEITWGHEKYPITRNLIEDGRKNLLLNGAPGSVNVRCPVRLIHGLSDEEVPYQLAVQLVDNLASSDASVVLLKKSTHSMDREADFKTMRSMIIEVIDAAYGGYDLTSPGSG